MLRRLRHVVTFGALSGALFSGARYARNRRRNAVAPGAEWPPFEPEPPTIVHPIVDHTIVADAGAQLRWVRPVNGSCPAGYPVKANDSSKIFHVPGGRSYDRTAAERCYANADDARADGYRAAKA
jgi:hypothetical protein